MFDGIDHLDDFIDDLNNYDPIEKLEINPDLTEAACKYNHDLNDFDTDTANENLNTILT